ncbi:MAG: hypothetical protein EOM02_02395 [Synergistales bacterium]|nr:hypothetical protein [Synergistales bacterium]
MAVQTFSEQLSRWKRGEQNDTLEIRIKGVKRTGRTHARLHKHITATVWRDVKPWIDKMVIEGQDGSIPMGGEGPKLEDSFMKGIRDAVELGYRQGGQLVRELSRKVFLADDWNAVLPAEALSWLDRYVPELARVYEVAVLEQVRDVISRSLREGLTLKRSTKELKGINREVSGFARHRLECIARTEAMRAYSMGHLRSAIDSREVVGFEFSAILDDRVSTGCQAREGLMFRIGDPRLPFNTPPLHPNCRSVLIPLLAIEFPEGIPDDPRIDSLPDTSQRDIDVEAVRSVLGGAQDMPATTALPLKFVPAKTVKEANEWAKKHIADDADYTGIRLEAINEWNRGIYETQQKFPELRKNFDKVGSCQWAYQKDYEYKVEAAVRRATKNHGWDPDGEDAVGYRNYLLKYSKTIKKREVSADTMAFSINEWSAPLKGIYVNKHHGGNITAWKKTLDDGVRSAFHPSRCDTIKSVVDHEMGHQIDKLVGGSSDAKLVALFEDMKERGKAASASELSIYGSYDVGEFIAEGWAEYMNSPYPRPTAKAIGERLEELYNGKKRRGTLNV